MDTILNSQNEEPSFRMEAPADKSELMQIFETQVKDAYWAYRDLLRAIFDADEGAVA